MVGTRRAVFLDRDGILIEDVGPLVDTKCIRIREDAPPALRSLKQAGFVLIGISNQAVVARGLASDSDVVRLQEQIEYALVQRGAPKLDGFYFCPHHPHADRAEYRCECSCRKPQPGLVLRACNEHDIDPQRSYMVGDRASDVVAGRSAGCRTIWARTGRHEDPPIVGASSEDIVADHACEDLGHAAAWILQEAA